MKSLSRVHQHDVAAATPTEPISAKLDSVVGGRSSSNNEHLSAVRQSEVDPLWMITAAMAAVFALLAVLVAVG